MNKEVIYLEPEDDITDILSKLQGAEQKLVALVPPKKATMLRSAVNMKLVARAAKESDKIAVIVTADPAIVKQAMLAQIPVAKNLQSRPVVPTKENVAELENHDHVINEDLGDASDTDNLPSKANTMAEKPAAGSTLNLSDRDFEDKSKKNAKGAKDKIVPNFEKYRKWIILGATAAVALVVLFVWALIFAPSTKIVVAMNTTASNFFESVYFTTNSADARPAEGKLLAEQQSYTDKFEAEFSATGQEDRGERAKGQVKVAYTLPKSFMLEKMNKNEGVKITVPAGSKLTAKESGLGYHTAEAVELVWDGQVTASSACTSIPCTLSKSVNIEADNSGANYDASAKTAWTISGNGWDAVGVEVPTVTTTSAISGGSTKMVTVVTKNDINKATESRNGASNVDGKSILLSQIPKGYTVIESSYNAEIGEVKTVPAVGEEATDKVKLTAETKYTIYAVENTQIDEYIKARTNLGEDQKIYSISDAYFERFVKIEEVARLKAVVKTGPTVTEQDIIERAKGRKNGEVQSLLRSINGVSSVKVEPSYFWVYTVPKDAERISVELTVEDK